MLGEFVLCCWLADTVRNSNFLEYIGKDYLGILINFRFFHKTFKQCVVYICFILPDIQVLQMQSIQL